MTVMTMIAEVTESLASAEPYVTEFEATITEIDGHEVRLEQTYFYAKGGGQPADLGTLNGIDVVDVQTQDGETVHTLNAIPDVEVGDTVDGQIDDEFRSYCMRAHTASHLVYGTGRKLFDDHGYGGFNISPKKIRLDFETSQNPDNVNALTVQRMVNEAVWESKEVTWKEINAEQARERDEIVFNLPDDAAQTETVRIVEVENWDIAACGGTHVQNTREIGPVKVLDVSNPGSDLIRVEFAVGSSAIQEQIDETRAVNRAAAVLDTSVADLPQRANKLIDEKRSLEEEVERLSEELLESQLTTLKNDIISKNGDNWIVSEVEEVGPNAVSERIQDLVDDTRDVVVLTGTDGSTFIVVGTTGEQDANEIIDDVTDEFGGGGGGRPTLAQGGGLNADPKSVVEYLSE